jgi:hypothetical protein
MKTDLKRTENEITLLNVLLKDVLLRTKKKLDTILKENKELMSSPNPDKSKLKSYTDREKELVKLLNQIERILVEFLDGSLPRQYSQTGQEVLDFLNILNSKAKINLDSKALNSLIKESIKDIKQGISFAKKQAQTLFKITKQEILKEKKINTSISKGFIETGDLKGAKAELISKFKEIMKDQKLIPVTCIRKDASTFIRNYKIDTYSELVARTRIAEAQILGTIEVSEEVGVNTFRVSSHNTTSEICKPHEGKIYTTDEKLFDLFKELNNNKPVYHPNCQHRINPRSFTKSEISAMRN